MESNLRFAFPVALGLLIAAGCDGKPIAKIVPDAGIPRANPDADTTAEPCPAGESRCGVGPFGTCEDLRTDPQHCGACGHACPAGIACADGYCQQIQCQLPVTFSARSDVIDSPSVSNLVDWLLADMNADGVLDRVSWTDGIYIGSIPDQPGFGGGFDIALGSDRGVFSPPKSFYTASTIQNVKVGHLNGDPIPDLFVSRAGLADETGPGMDIWINPGGAYPTIAPTIQIPEATGPLAVADFDGDGKNDLVTAGGWMEGNPTLALRKRNVDGMYPTVQTLPRKGDVLVAFPLDWDGDGDSDLATADDSPDSLQIYLNTGTGSFEPPIACTIRLSYPGPFSVADFNQDGRPDLVYVDGSTLAVLLGKGGCDFQPPRTQTLPFGANTLDVADVTGDGRLDVVTQLASGHLDILAQTPAGTFDLTSYEFPPSQSIRRIQIADLNQDGRPDIVQQGAGNTLSVLENTCPPTGAATP